MSDSIDSAMLDCKLKDDTQRPMSAVSNAVTVVSAVRSGALMLDFEVRS